MNTTRRGTTVRFDRCTGAEALREFCDWDRRWMDPTTGKEGIRDGLY